MYLSEFENNPYDPFYPLGVPDMWLRQESSPNSDRKILGK